MGGRSDEIRPGQGLNPRLRSVAVGSIGDPDFGFGVATSRVLHLGEPRKCAGPTRRDGLSLRGEGLGRRSRVRPLDATNERDDRRTGPRSVNTSED